MTSNRGVCEVIAEAFVVSFHLGADLKQRGRLFHDSNEQCVDVILQIFDQKLHLL